MWKTIITNVVKDKGIFSFTVEFYKDEALYTSYLFDRVSEPSSIKQLVRNQLAQYQKIDELDENSLVGDLDLTLPPVEEPEIVTPSKEVVDEEKYSENIAKLRSYEKAIALGITEKTDQNYLDLQTTLKSDFKPEYLKLISGI